MIPLSADRIAAFGTDARYRISVFPVLSSTNAFVKDLAASGAPTGTVVLAERQTAGRGRLGRSFYSPMGSGIYLTVLLRPRFAPRDASSVTTFAAVAVARAMERVCDVRAEIKWVNDVWINGRKVCGILAEATLASSGAAIDSIALGIGINVTESAFPEELLRIATSLERESGVRVDRNHLTALLLEELSPLLDGNAPSAHMDEYRRRSFVLGREITVVSGDRSFPATASRIEEDGNLIVLCADGREERIVAGEVSLRLQ